jgi:hypothetical protein
MDIGDDGGDVVDLPISDVDSCICDSSGIEVLKQSNDVRVRGFEFMRRLLNKIVSVEVCG